MREEAREAIRCQWTHTDEATGKKYLCSNERFVHPWRRVVDRFGVSVLEEFSCCASVSASHVGAFIRCDSYLTHDDVGRFFVEFEANS